MMSSTKGSWISVCYHPVLLGMGCVLLVLYQFFPFLFSLLVKSSPVIVCTLLLLGFLLSYGEPNIPETEEDDSRTEEISSSELESVSADHVVMKGERSKVETNVVNRRASKRIAAKETVLADRSAAATSNVRKEDVAISKVNNVTEQELANSLTSGLSNGVDIKTKNLTTGNGHANVVDAERSTDFKGESGECSMEHGYDSSVGSSWHPMDHKDASSDSDSDVVESSNASVSEVLPMLDELDPLLDSDAPQPALASKDNSDDGSSAFSQDHESNDGSIMEEAENPDDEEDDEAPEEEKDEGNKVVVKWTADDQRNLVDLGKSELERNRRLENLIAKRRARKILLHQMEKNLIDLDGNDSLPNNGNGQLPSVYAPRKNPFDLPFDADDIPGSAPSVLLPRPNPFDLPFDPVEQSEAGTADNSIHHQEFVAAPTREMLFRRHESFSVGDSFLGDMKQERRYSKFRPYFEVEIDSDERSFSNLHGLLREISDSRVNLPQPGMVPPVVTDQQHGIEAHQDSESSAKQNEESTDQASQSSEEDVSLDVEHDENEVHASDDVVVEQNYQAAEASETVEADTSEELELNSNVSDAQKAEVIDEVYESGSSTPEVNEMSSEMRVQEHLTEAEETPHDSSTVSNKEMNADSELLNQEIEQVHDNCVVDPVYDSSPKSLSNLSTQDEAPSNADKEDLTLNNSSTSNAQASASKVGSPPKTTKIRIASEEQLASVDEFPWVASPSLASVDKIESTSREVSMIKERDVIGDELSRVHDDFGINYVPVLLEPAERHSVLSRMSAVETESREGS